MTCVRRALIKDGWTITHDPFAISWDERRMYAHLGAERLLAAERSNRRIAVEIKRFLGNSPIDDLEKALGQFILYRAILERTDPDRELLLAIPYDVTVVFTESLGQLLIEANLIRAFSFDPVTEGAYVIMPEHAHLLLWPCQTVYDISEILNSIKQSVAKRAATGRRL